MARVKLRKSDAKTEFGDFQTPERLAQHMCRLLAGLGVSPASILEPTCGRGSILAAALSLFPTATKAIGLEVNGEYAEDARTRVQGQTPGKIVEVLQGDFFSTEWRPILENLPDPLLIVGNHPWVTNATLGGLGSENLPVKVNAQQLRGIDALTGKSNFDISEWMLRRMLEWVNGRNACIAMLCKTAVARKILLYGWSRGFDLLIADIFRIDAAEEFRASVDACLLVMKIGPGDRTRECRDHAIIQEATNSPTFGYRQGRLVADIAAYEQWKHLEGDEICQWRSGVKHDCAKVFELQREGTCYLNGLGERSELESECLYPMLKGSEVANGTILYPSRWMLVPQTSIGQETKPLQMKAPNTWAYLTKNSPLLDARGSRIYRGKPRFSVFGVGDYTFAPWKVAIAGLYKTLTFRSVGPFQEKPIVFDDTCYFLPCRTEEAALTLCNLLNSEAAKGFFRAYVFWDAKRPVTIDLLQRLDLIKLARENNVSVEIIESLRQNLQPRDNRHRTHKAQGLLFEEVSR